MATILISKKYLRCDCDCGDKCPLGKMGMQARCTKEELEAEGYKTRKSRFIK